jgi:hypothetical protein
VGFLALSPLRLPFGGLSPRYAPAALKLSLQAFIPAAGTHTLEIDDLLLLPQDNFAWFDTPAGIGSGARLMDDSFARESYTVVDGQQLRAHKRVGAWFELPAGARSWFTAFRWMRMGRRFPRQQLVCGLGAAAAGKSCEEQMELNQEPFQAFLSSREGTPLFCRAACGCGRSRGRLRAAANARCWTWKTLPAAFRSGRN